MPHRSDKVHELTVKSLILRRHRDLERDIGHFNDVCIVRLPGYSSVQQYGTAHEAIGPIVASIAHHLGPQATMITIGETPDLVEVQDHISNDMRFHHWIVIKRASPKNVGSGALPSYHFGALVHTKYDSSLKHTRTRIKYTYCPVCDKTTKDYGGKKHTYHRYGTSISDVWRDIGCDLEGDLEPVLSRFGDLFGIESYDELLIVDLTEMSLGRAQDTITATKTVSTTLPERLTDKIVRGDCMVRFKQIPDGCIDFAFADPPYNLGKKYIGYEDDLEIKDYFDWCDRWLSEMARVLKPGRTCAVLNIPLWAIRHFLFLRTKLRFQNWIAWDALAYPVRLIMPAHYGILCFRKGEARELPGLKSENEPPSPVGAPDYFQSLSPLGEWYCLRSSCVRYREAMRIDDRGPLTDLWWDIHRLKHNSRRVDHPCQLPPALMYRLISVFTLPGEAVLDPFNGAGTTTLAADILGRRYLGLEIEEEYCRMARDRHKEIRRGINPFRKRSGDRVLTSKNSPVPRMGDKEYEVPKKTLQLEVKRIAERLGRLPDREEVKKHSEYPIRYYDDYFASWGEVCAAARTTGMTEDRKEEEVDRSPHSSQPRLL